MKAITKFGLITFLAAILLLAFPAQVLASGGPPGPDGLVIGGVYRLENGETLYEDLTIIGGKGTLEDGSKVLGDIFITGGSLVVYGEVDGEITALGAVVHLGDSAVVNGNVVTIPTGLTKSTGAVIRGDVIGSSSVNYNFPAIIFPFPLRVPLQHTFLTALQSFNPLGDIPKGILDSLILAALGALIMLMLPNPVERVRNGIAQKPVSMAGIGLLTLLVVLLATITILLIPLVLLASPILVFGYLVGWIALGLELGRRMEELLKVHWAPPVSAGLGVLVLTLVSEAVDLIPCIGWIVPFFLGIVGLGAVIITRFGSRDYIERRVYPSPVRPSAPLGVQGNNQPSNVGVTSYQPAVSSSRPIAATPQEGAEPEVLGEQKQADIQSEASLEDEQPATPPKRKRSTKKSSSEDIDKDVIDIE